MARGIRSRLLALGFFLGVTSSTGCVAECVNFNDCPQGQFCSDARSCETFVGAPPEQCMANGESIYFLPEGDLSSATHFTCNLPVTTDTEYARVVAHEGNTSMVSGGSTELLLSWNQSELGEGALADKFLYWGLRGTRSMYAIPLTASTPNPIPFELFLPQGVPSGAWTASVSIVDASPDLDPDDEEAVLVVGPIYDIDFDIIAVQSGDIQISISWDTATDVDLHVQPPGEETIYFGNRRVDSGGELDLDANAACGQPLEHNENVYWPDDAAPTGTYKVWVDYWSACNEVGVTSFRVTRILRRNDIAIYEETFIMSDVQSDPYSEGTPLFEFVF